MADQKVREMEPVETQIVEIMPPDVENLIYVVRNKQVIQLIDRTDSESRNGNCSGRWICGCRNIKYFVKEERKCGGDSLYTATDKIISNRCR